MNNKELLIVILLIVIGILAVSIMEYSKASPTDNIVESVNEVSEDVDDSLDDITNPN